MSSFTFSYFLCLCTDIRVPWLAKSLQSIAGKVVKELLVMVETQVKVKSIS